jgi:hypothetical protein
MDTKALDAARVELDRADQAMDELIASKHLVEVQRRWLEFLDCFANVYNKLEIAVGKGDARWAAIARERKEDALLQYLEQARHAHTHGVEPVTLAQPGRIQAVAAKLMDPNKPEAGVVVTCDITNPHVKLVDVLNRGRIYAVPTMFRGAPFSTAHPTNVGLLALSYMSDLVASLRSS